MTKEDLLKLREVTATHLAVRKSLGAYNAEAESIITLIDGQLKLIDYMIAFTKIK